ncbi:MAG: GAF domain-containing protein, partial [Cyanobacteria bacterium P01_C01_bin.69]
MASLPQQKQLRLSQPCEQGLGSIGTTELERYNQELRQRDALLNSVNAAAQSLITTHELAIAIPEALRILGEGTQQDRVYVFENVYPNGPDDVFWNVPYEWTAHTIPLGSEISAGDLPIAMASFPSEIVTPFLKEGTIRFLTRDLTGKSKSFNDDSQTLSLVAVPILISDQWWGVLGFDDCTTERVWSDAEVAVLETAASCIGSAIERDQTRQEKEAAAQARVAELAERDRILEATAAAANVMLTDNNFENAVNRALQIVGEGLTVDRIALGQHFDASSEQSTGYHQFLYEWASIDTSLQSQHPELVVISDEGMEFALGLHCQGKVFGGVVNALPEPFRSSQIELGVQSTYSVPITVDGSYWGFIAFDDCHKQTRRSESELEALMTLANCIGSAISREQTQKAREAAEREALIATERAARAAELEAANQVLVTRDRWLQTTAAAANELLSATDINASVDAALATIGENLDCDRLSVMRYESTHISHPLGAMVMLHEWDAEGVRAQIDDPELHTVSANGFEDWFEQLLAGKSIGGRVSQLLEPARSEMASLGILSTYAIPILINETLWGVVGMDYCQQEKQLGDSELAVFKTAATCVGSAIYQAQARQDKAAQERAKLLGSVAEAANLLLRSADYTTVLPEVVRLLGEAAKCDRCGVVTTRDATLSLSSSVYLMAEWYKEGIPPAHDGTPELDAMTWQQFAEFYECLVQEKPANYLVSELSEPARGAFESQSVSSVVYLPIVVAGKPWGQIGFDNCSDPRLYDGAEISILKVAAENIAAAIARQAQDKALRDAERVVLEERERAEKERAQLLGSVAEAANLLLRTANYVTVLPEVTRLLGEAVGSDRCGVTQDIVIESSGDLATKIIEEWCREGIGFAVDVAPNSFPQPNIFPIKGDFLKIHQTLRHGEVVNFHITDLSGDEKAFLEAQGNTAMLIVPIMVQGKIWGSMGFDNCGEPRLYDEAEISILKVAAESIAAAIARQAQEDSVREAEERYRNLI